MCGIVACLGAKNGSCREAVKYGITRLQNRGNDSYGFCSLDRDRKFRVAKVANPDKKTFVEMLGGQLSQIAKAKTAMAHCRWATHGANTDKNAHPHLDHSARFAIVHNGTIDNYAELRQELQSKGVEFRSDTDSEVLVNLIASCYTGSVQQAIEQAITRIRGIYACALMFSESPSELWAFHHFCPLLLGWNSDLSQYVVASEKTGFNTEIEFCAPLKERKVYQIQLGQVVIPAVNRQRIDHSRVTPDDPSPFAHWMMREIHEQKGCLLHLISSRTYNGRLKFPELEPHLRTLVKADHVILIGCGTSYYAAKYSRHFLKSLDIYGTIQCLDASEFDVSYLPSKSKTVCVLFSQSGETMDLIRVQQQLNGENIFNLAVVNVPDSTIQRNASTSILTEAGVEVAVASTKSYSCQIMIVKLLSLWMEQQLNCNISDKLESLGAVADQVDSVINKYSEKLKTWAAQLADCCHLFILGKRNGYCLAKEASLKLKEVGYLHAESYSASALKHGPYSLIEPGNPIMFIVSRDDANEALNNTIAEVRSRGAITWVITDWEEAPDCDDIIQLPYNSELYGILHIIPFQLLSYYIANEKGHNPDYPRNLAKSVTVD